MIAVVLGTNAEMLRMEPVLKRLKDYTLVLTGQNEVNAEGIKLQSFKGVGTSVLKGTCRFLSARHELREKIRLLKPSFIVYQGDTATTLLASMAARSEGLPRAHIEAGFRSGSIWSPLPEEAIRRMADSRSTLLFAPSIEAEKNLAGKGEVILSGSTVWDNLNDVMPFRQTARRGYVIMTAHRYENILVRSRLKRLVAIAQMVKAPVVWPMHEMTRKRIKDAGLWPLVDRLGTANLISYPMFMTLLKNCDFVITDGGGLEDEASILGKRCILLRDRTERPECRSKLVGLDLEKAAEAISLSQFADGDLPPTPYPYFFGRSPSRIIAERLMS